MILKQPNVAVMSAYATKILPISPIISLGELCDVEPNLAFSLSGVPKTLSGAIPKQLGKLVVCAAAALCRDVPKRIYSCLATSLAAKMEGPEGARLMTCSSIGHIQLLAVISMSPELHSDLTSRGGSLSFLRSGSAIRMAFDLVRFVL